MLNPLSLPTPHRTVIRLDSLALDATGRDTHRRALLELTDQHLADIGIDRQTARREAAKHFWQA